MFFSLNCLAGTFGSWRIARLRPADALAHLA